MGERFDFILGGAGSAGCLLANRLSEDPKNRVLLLEAGGKDDWIWFHIPVGYLFAIGNPRADWMFQTEKEPGLNGRALNYPRGKVVGGSSAGGITALFLTYTDVSRTPAARSLHEMRLNEESFFDFALRMSKVHQSYFKELLPTSASRQDEFAAEAAESLEQQAHLESADKVSFEEYLARYFSA